MKGQKRQFHDTTIRNKMYENVQTEKKKFKKKYKRKKTPPSDKGSIPPKGVYRLLEIDE